MTSRVAEIERLVAKTARNHDTLAVGTYAGGEATFYDGDKSWDDALFEIGSITKPFTGVLLADLTLAGELALDDPVTTCLPDTSLPQWKERPPTLEGLATHRAALPVAPGASAASPQPPPKAEPPSSS